MALIRRNWVSSPTAPERDSKLTRVNEGASTEPLASIVHNAPAAEACLRLSRIHPVELPAQVEDIGPEYVGPGAGVLAGLDEQNPGLGLVLPQPAGEDAPREAASHNDVVVR